MQTFLPYTDPIKCAKVLDNKRLGKQRVETIQILQILTNIKPNSQWRNHPADKMWKGYEPFLLWNYLTAIMFEWKNRGFKNTKCQQHFNIFTKIPIVLKNKIKPPWLNDEFCKCHQSNLIRKNPSYYRPLFSGVPDNLPYIWPVK